MNTLNVILIELFSVRGLCTLGFSASIIYLAITGREVPPILSSTAQVTLGFFFAKTRERVRNGVASDKEDGNAGSTTDH